MDGLIDAKADPADGDRLDVLLALAEAWEKGHDMQLFSGAARENASKSSRKKLF